jgi:Tfp pilus assembly PilM family ATPase
MVTLPSLLKPRLPQAALSLSSETACMIELDKKRSLFTVRRAAEMSLPAGLINSNFDEANIADLDELRARLAELAAHASLSRRKRWSAALPEAATRTGIVTIEEAPASRTEFEEMLRWKTERSFGVPLDELRVRRVRLNSVSANGARARRERYLITAIRTSVLAEYEAVFAALNWRAGLIVPRHAGEEFWLSRERARILRDKQNESDALLISAHRQGFTAVVMRGGEPLFLRNVQCEPQDSADELYRFLLYYRERGVESAASEADGDDAARLNRATPSPLTRLLVTGSAFDLNAARNIVAETFSAIPQIINAEDARLQLPSSEFAFAQYAAPAGLAALAWR